MLPAGRPISQRMPITSASRLPSEFTSSPETFFETGRPCSRLGPMPAYLSQLTPVGSGGVYFVPWLRLLSEPLLFDCFKMSVLLVPRCDRSESGWSDLQKVLPRTDQPLWLDPHTILAHQ